LLTFRPPPAETSWSEFLKNPEFSARVAELAEAAAQDAVMTARPRRATAPTVEIQRFLPYIWLRTFRAGLDPSHRRRRVEEPTGEPLWAHPINF
jgi:hypothetical protein